MTYQVHFKRSAEKELGQLQRDIALAVAAVIDSLRGDPRPPGTKKLTGHQSVYRVRVRGDYRIVYEVFDEQKTVHVTKIGHRSEIYRRR